MFNDRFGEITQKPNPPFITAYASQGDLVRTAESFSLTAIVADNGIQRGLNAVLTEGERVKKFGFLQSELDRAKKDLQRGTEQAYAERDKTNSTSMPSRTSPPFCNPNRQRAFSTIWMR